MAPRIDAKAFMDEIYQLFELKAQKSGLVLSYKIEEGVNTFESDVLRLKQVLINLIGNALKFTNEGSVYYDIKVHKDKLMFLVKDTGIGIPSEKKKNGF